MQKKPGFLSLHLLMLVSLAACSPAAGPAATPTPSPTAASTLPAFTATPSQVPTQSPAEVFGELSRKWRVAFIDPTSRQACVMSGDGSSKSCLEYPDSEFPNGDRRTLGSWSPDGSRFAYDRNDDTGIFIWDLRDGSLTAFQAAGEGLVFRGPVWSPDGGTLAYKVIPVAYWDIPADVPGTYLERLDYSSKVRLSAENVSVSWSPDGRSLLFSDGELTTARFDGSDPARLSGVSGEVLQPEWSPDGGRIAFLRRNGSMNDLYIMNADGSGVRKVTELALRNTYAMLNYTWMPSGTQILYDYVLIDVETGAATRLDFPFDPSAAVWFMKSEEEGAVPLPAGP